MVKHLMVITCSYLNHIVFPLQLLNCLYHSIILCVLVEGSNIGIGKLLVIPHKITRMRISFLFAQSGLMEHGIMKRKLSSNMSLRPRTSKLNGVSCLWQAGSQSNKSQR